MMVGKLFNIFARVLFEKRSILSFPPTMCKIVF